jgi:glycosyltransferase involved in cell wall biosynthesis
MRYFCGEILPRIRAVEPRVRLRITGQAPQVAQKELSADNAVLFTGYVDDVRPLVRASAVCVVPLRLGGGTRLKILEAMALGTAVVSTTKGAEGLNVTNERHLLLADTPREFAEATLRLLNDAELRARLSRAARDRVSREYDWHKIQVSFDETVERAVSRSRTVG